MIVVLVAACRQRLVKRKNVRERHPSPRSRKLLLDPSEGSQGVFRLSVNLVTFAGSCRLKLFRHFVLSQWVTFDRRRTMHRTDDEKMLKICVPFLWQDELVERQPIGLDSHQLVFERARIEIQSKTKGFPICRVF